MVVLDAVQYVPNLVETLFNEAKAKAIAKYPANELIAACSFDKGHYLEICKNISAKDGDTEKPRTLPLFWLVMDFDETIAPLLGIYADIKLQFIIACDTEQNYTMDQRRDNSFLPILYPLYREFIEVLQYSPFCNNHLPAQLTHRKTDRPYWGGQDTYGNGEANLFNHFIDAVQVRDLTMQLKKQFCTQFSI